MFTRSSTGQVYLCACAQINTVYDIKHLNLLIYIMFRKNKNNIFLKRFSLCYKEALACKCRYSRSAMKAMEIIFLLLWIRLVSLPEISDIDIGQIILQL